MTGGPLGQWRPMTGDDLDQVMAIAALVHPGYPEDRAVFADRLALFPAGCLMAQGDTPMGYGVAHPGLLGQPPALNTLLGRLPQGADCLYLHDVALLPMARGQGLAGRIVGHLDHLARDLGLGCLALTSVSGSFDLWRHLGFVPRPCPAIASYGDAHYMIRTII